MSDPPAAEAVDSQPLIIEPVDIQHDTDPAQDHAPARRIPHLGHAILFFSIAVFFINLCLVVVFSVLHIHLEQIEQHPFLALAAQAAAYAFTLLSAVWLFPRLWQHPFLRGIQWNILAARRRWYWLVSGGIALCAVVTVLMLYIPQPKDTSIDLLMRTPRGAWTVAAFAVLLAPVVEEIAFRGFLLPALATAYDWLALERSPAGLERWKNSTLHSTSSDIFAAIFSSIPFALLHAGQLSHAWGVVAVLYGVSLVLSFVRIRTHSVASSTLMHVTYNLSIFAVVFFSSGGFRHLEHLPK